MNNVAIEDKMEREIESCLDALNEMELGSQEYEKGVASLTSLYRLRMDEVSNSCEYWNKVEQAKIQLKDQRIDRYVRYGLEGASIFAPLVVYSKLFKQGLIFEKDGIISSTFFRNLAGKIKIGK